MGMNLEAQDIMLDDHAFSRSLKKEPQSSFIIPVAIATVGGLGLYSLYRNRKGNQSSISPESSEDKSGLKNPESLDHRQDIATEDNSGSRQDDVKGNQSSVLPESSIPSRSEDKRGGEGLKDTSDNDDSVVHPSDSSNEVRNESTIDNGSRQDVDDNRSDLSESGDQGTASGESNGITEDNSAEAKFTREVQRLQSLGLEEAKREVYDKIDELNRTRIWPLLGYESPMVANASDFDKLYRNHLQHKAIDTNIYLSYSGGSIQADKTFFFKCSRNKNQEHEAVDSLLGENRVESSDGGYRVLPPYSIDLSAIMSTHVVRLISTDNCKIQIEGKEYTINTASSVYLLGSSTYAMALKQVHVNAAQSRLQEIAMIKDELSIYDMLQAAYPLDTFIYEKERGYKTLFIDGTKLDVCDELPGLDSKIENLSAEDQALMLKAFKFTKQHMRTCDDTSGPNGSLNRRARTDSGFYSSSISTYALEILSQSGKACKFAFAVVDVTAKQDWYPIEGFDHVAEEFRQKLGDLASSDCGKLTFGTTIKFENGYRTYAGHVNGVSGQPIYANSENTTSLLFVRVQGARKFRIAKLNSNGASALEFDGTDGVYGFDLNNLGNPRIAFSVVKSMLSAPENS